MLEAGSAHHLLHVERFGVMRRNRGRGERDDGERRQDGRACEHDPRGSAAPRAHARRSGDRDPVRGHFIVPSAIRGSSQPTMRSVTSETTM